MVSQESILKAVLGGLSRLVIIILANAPLFKSISFRWSALLEYTER